MSNSKENKKCLINKSWHVKYELVYNYFCSVADLKGFKPSVRGFCDFLGISAGKRQKWSQGQWPSAEDLETLHDKLGFSYRWLITGEGDPFEEGGTLPEADEEKRKADEQHRQRETRLQELEQKNAELEAELREANRLNRQLTTRFLVDGVGDKGAATDTGKVGEGQG